VFIRTSSPLTPSKMLIAFVQKMVKHMNTSFIEMSINMCIVIIVYVYVYTHL